MRAAYRTRLSLGICLSLCASGCAGLATPQSQLFSAHSQHQSASIVYRLSPPAAASAEGVQLASYNQASIPTSAAAPHKGPQRRTTLALRYPHPTGRAGYARVELVVERIPEVGRRSSLPAWLDRLRQTANSNLPGLALADGIEEALALDLSVAELDHLFASLGQSTGEPAVGGASAMLLANIDGTALPASHAPRAELNKLIGRVRREGSLISHPGLGADFQFAVPGPTAPAYAAPNSAVPAYAAPNSAVLAYAAPPYAAVPANTMPSSAVPAAEPPAVAQAVVQASYVATTLERLPQPTGAAPATAP